PVAQGGTEAKFKVLGPAVHGVKPVTVRVPENAVRIPAAVKYPGGEGSGFVSVFGSPLPTFVETEPNDSTNTVNSVTIPIAINGRFEKDRDRDFFQFEAWKDQRLAIRGRTRSLGSPCDLFLQLQKADGSKLAEANVTGASEGALTNTFAAAGTYRLLVEELTRRGGPGRVTHLKIVGRAEIGGHENVATASTMPALRKLFPLIRYPPAGLDGLIGLGIKPAPKPPEAKVEK